ncbi:MAG: hypothetical protein LBT51_07550 [Fusobacteriaceae bacterium]|jgi:hypothetical protein|nr:hypothetical protein [Fusobacteriaceae bacterium]
MIGIKNDKGKVLKIPYNDFPITGIFTVDNRLIDGRETTRIGALIIDINDLISINEEFSFSSSSWGLGREMMGITISVKSLSLGVWYILECRNKNSVNKCYDWIKKFIILKMNEETGHTTFACRSRAEYLNSNLKDILKKYEEAILYLEEYYLGKQLPSPNDYKPSEDRINEKYQKDSHVDENLKVALETYWENDFEINKEYDEKIENFLQTVDPSKAKYYSKDKYIKKNSEKKEIDEDIECRSMCLPREELERTYVLSYYHGFTNLTIK